MLDPLFELLNSKAPYVFSKLHLNCLNEIIRIYKNVLDYTYLLVKVTFILLVMLVAIGASLYELIPFDTETNESEQYLDQLKKLKNIEFLKVPASMGSFFLKVLSKNFINMNY